MARCLGKRVHARRLLRSGGGLQKVHAFSGRGIFAFCDEGVDGRFCGSGVVYEGETKLYMQDFAFIVKLVAFQVGSAIEVYLKITLQEVQ